ncbi:MAG TPA: SymE family type I addiction module toxin [Bacteroidia bacterium]|nr:SymE family type I addiction module toxin [Bacteroidia bacterium]
MSTEENSSNSSKRFYKVYYGNYTYTNERHPLIRLKGKYLNDLNFKIGDVIEITFEDNRIIIEKVVNIKLV